MPLSSSSLSLAYIFCYTRIYCSPLDSLSDIMIDNNDKDCLNFKHKELNKININSLTTNAQIAQICSNSDLCIVISSIEATHEKQPNFSSSICGLKYENHESLIMDLYFSAPFKPNCTAVSLNCFTVFVIIFERSLFCYSLISYKRQNLPTISLTFLDEMPALRTSYLASPCSGNRMPID